MIFFQYRGMILHKENHEAQAMLRKYRQVSHTHAICFWQEKRMDGLREWLCSGKSKRKLNKTNCVSESMT